MPIVTHLHSITAIKVIKLDGNSSTVDEVVVFQDNIFGVEIMFLRREKVGTDRWRQDLATALEREPDVSFGRFTEDHLAIAKELRVDFQRSFQQ